MGRLLERQSNMELLRIISMMMILVIHANQGIGTFFSQQGSNYTIEMIRALVHCACIIGVNTFVLISGWFGIRASFKGLTSIMFQTAFYSLTIALIYSLFKGTPIPLKDLFFSCLGSKSYWFVTSYVILYILSPYLNSFLNSATQRSLLFSIAAFFLAQQLYGRFGGDLGHFAGGYSTLSFIGLYLLAGVTRRFPNKVTNLPALACFSCYAALTLLMLGLIILFKDAIIGGGHSIFHYNHPIVILSSFFFFLAFTHMKIMSKIINWVAASTFAIYLIHDNFLIRGDYQAIMNKVYYHFQFPLSFLIVFVAILTVGTGCILIDKVRVLLWGKISFYLDSNK